MLAFPDGETAAEGQGRRSRPSSRRRPAGARRRPTGPRSRRAATSRSCSGSFWHTPRAPTQSGRGRRSPPSSRRRPTGARRRPTGPRSRGAATSRSCSGSFWHTPTAPTSVRARETIAAIEQVEARRRQEATDWAKVEKGGDKQELQRFALAYPESANVGPGAGDDRRHRVGGGPSAPGGDRLGQGREKWRQTGAAAVRRGLSRRRTGRPGARDDRDHRGGGSPPARGGDGLGQRREERRTSKSWSASCRPTPRARTPAGHAR